VVDHVFLLDVRLLKSQAQNMFAEEHGDMILWVFPLESLLAKDGFQSVDILSI
jgi:hypothetical protein